MALRQSDCSTHACWRTAPGGYCLEPRCYCGSCPWWLPADILPTNTPDIYTAIDRQAILSTTGRRTNLAQYRAAQSEKPARTADAAPPGRL